MTLPAPDPDLRCPREYLSEAERNVWVADQRIAFDLPAPTIYVPLKGKRTQKATRGPSEAAGATQ